MNENKIKIIALLATLLLMLLLVTGLVIGKLYSTSLPPAADGEWPPLPEPDETEFVEVIDDPVFQYKVFDVSDNVLEINDSDEPSASDRVSDDPTQLAFDPNNNASTEGVSTNLNTSTEESDAKHKNVDKPGNRTPSPEEKAAAEAEAKRQQTNKKIDSTFENRKWGSGTGNGEGKTNDDMTDGVKPDGGTGGTGKESGAYTIRKDKSTSSNEAGIIVITCIVKPDGSVAPGSAKFTTNGSSGKPALDDDLKDACINETYKNKFARKKGESTNLSARIKFVWK